MIHNRDRLLDGFDEWQHLIMYAKGLIRPSCEYVRKSNAYIPIRIFI